MTYEAAVATTREAIGTRHDTVFGYTNPYGAQCLAFIAWYAYELGYITRIMPGYNAIDVYLNNPLGMERVSAPQPGDIFFQNAVFNRINLGHTGVVSQIVPNGILGIAQNARNPSLTVGSPASEDFYSSKTIAGYLRPEFKGGFMNQEEVDKIYKNIDNINKRLDKELNNLYKIIDSANKRVDRLSNSSPEELEKIGKAINDFKEAIK